MEEEQTARVQVEEVGTKNEGGGSEVAGDEPSVTKAIEEVGDQVTAETIAKESPEDAGVVPIVESEESSNGVEAEGENAAGVSCQETKDEVIEAMDVEEIEATETGEGDNITSEGDPEGIVQDPDELEEEGTEEPETVEFKELDDDKTLQETLENAETKSNSEDNNPADCDPSSLEKVAEDPLIEENIEGKATLESIAEADEAEIVEADNNEMENEDEEILEILPKKDCFLYSIKGDNLESSRARDWCSSEPIWTGKLQLLSQGPTCVVKLEDDQQILYGYTVIESYPGDVLRPVTDSTRYFTIKFTKDNADINEPDTEEIAGLAFSNRTDSTDFIWTVASHLKSTFNPDRSKTEDNVTDVKVEETKASQATNADSATSAAVPQITAKRKLSGDQASEPAKRVIFQDQVPTSSSHIVIEGGDVDSYVKHGLKRPGIFSCHLCSASFDDNRHIRTHWYKVHKLRHNAVCVDCHRPFPTAEKMVEHRRDIHGYKCPKCEMSFKLDRQLESHFLSVHQEKLEFLCSGCESKFETRPELKKHLVKEHPSSLVKCPDCPDKFFTPAELAAHVGAHEKFIFCHLCDAGFTLKGELRTHLEVKHDGAAGLQLF